MGQPTRAVAARCSTRDDDGAFALPDAEQENAVPTMADRLLQTSRRIRILVACVVCGLLLVAATWLAWTGKEEEPFTPPSSRWTYNDELRSVAVAEAHAARRTRKASPPPEPPPVRAPPLPPLRPSPKPPPAPPPPLHPPAGPPPSPLSPPLPLSPLPTTAAEAVARLNFRFRRSPFIDWPADGQLAAAGVLLHCFDDWEDKERPWAPRERRGYSTSLIFAGQRGGGGDSVPTYPMCRGGLIFRPGRHTRVLCGAGGDCGGRCNSFCPQHAANWGSNSGR